MEMKPQNVCVLIPSLEPDGRLLAYVKSLLERGFHQVLIVDDGSGPSYQPIFEELDQLAGCTVLHHPVNRGKGCALKTGYQYIEKQMRDVLGVVTADADGQHTVKDVWALSARLAAGEKGLLLGSRDFSLPQVPPKSRTGNRITSCVFWMLYARWLPDTQTGLRGFLREYLPFMEGVEGDRFEYEMNVLIACSRDKLPMAVVPIDTVYHDDNKGTHFHPFRDSLRIYKVIFQNFFKFMSSSLIATGVDWLLCFILLDALANPLAQSPELVRIGVATYAARLISASINFILNKNFVFHLKSQGHKALFRYILVCIGIAALSSLAVTLLHTALGMQEKIAKVICDTLLYFLSYQAQRRWVFAPAADKPHAVNQKQTTDERNC